MEEREFDSQFMLIEELKDLEYKYQDKGIDPNILFILRLLIDHYD